ncbi:MAG: hypothetical protein ABH816_03565 [Candidatus Levyibacteriota bacterium]
MNGEPRSEVGSRPSLQQVESRINRHTKGDSARRAELRTKAQIIVPTIGLDIPREQRRVIADVARMAGERARREVEEKLAESPVEVLDNILYEVAEGFPEGDERRRMLCGKSQNLRKMADDIHEMVEKIQVERELEGKPAGVEDVFQDELKTPGSFQSRDYLYLLDHTDPSVLEPVLKRIGLLTDRATLPLLINLARRNQKWHHVSESSEQNGWVGDLATNLSGVSATIVEYKPRPQDGIPKVSYALTLRLDKNAVIKVANSPRGESVFPPPTPQRV